MPEYTSVQRDYARYRKEKYSSGKYGSIKGASPAKIEECMAGSKIRLL